MTDISGLLEGYAPLFDGPGAGYFSRDEMPVVLAKRIRADFEDCNQTFIVPNAVERFFDPLAVALEILSSLLPLCFSLSRQDEIVANVEAVLGRRSSHHEFNRSFLQRTAVVFPSEIREGQLDTLSGKARRACDRIAEASQAEVITGIAELRDALLEMCEQCSK